MNRLKFSLRSIDTFAVCGECGRCDYLIKYIHYIEYTYPICDECIDWDRVTVTGYVELDEYTIWDMETMMSNILEPHVVDEASIDLITSAIAAFTKHKI